ncbi:lipocalin-15 isoform X3 [Hyaena hyaena]|uniref:lipocalin-15 isoform X3 n=1 Tax=Hyaena hyaena TaxID=95912 RepID=UPI0019229E73|nr:lipocalin-15 isoform X3 [Hyaena hyaena]
MDKGDWGVQSQVPSEVSWGWGGRGIKPGVRGCDSGARSRKAGMGMKRVILGHVLVLLWVPAAWAEVLVQPHFDAKKFSGLWYVASMVSDCKVFLGKKDHLLMSTRLIKAEAGGNLSVHMEVPRPGLPGPAHRGRRLQLLRRGLCLQGAAGGAQHHGRTQEPSPQAVKAFRDFYPTVGLSDDMAVMLPKSEE